VPGVTDAAASNGVLLGIVLCLLFLGALGFAVWAIWGIWCRRPARRNARMGGFSALALTVLFAVWVGLSLWTVLFFLIAFGLLLFGFAPKKWSDGTRERMAKVKAARPQRPTPPPAE
jgi:hypothetical protein